MQPTSSQFPDREPKSNNIPKKIKSSGGSNPYKQLNQMLDFQIKQEKLEDLKKKKKLWPPPRVKRSFGENLIRLEIRVEGFSAGQ